MIGLNDGACGAKKALLPPSLGPAFRLSKTAPRGFVRLCFLPLMILGLTACGDSDFADLEQYAAEVKGRSPSGVEPLPVVTSAEMFTFNPEGLRDPFTPAPPPDVPAETEMAGDGGVQPDLTRPREELEAYALDSLRMVGTADLQEVRWGLVRAADGTIHRVRAGNYLGRNHGKILRIMDDHIEIMEILADAKPGRWLERQASLALAE